MSEQIDQQNNTAEQPSMFQVVNEGFTTREAIEARTRNDEQTDMIIDYLGQQYIIEMKIWHGNAYNERGEKQLSDYLEYYHVDKGYMLSFNFNKNKKIGVKEVVLGEKLLIEAVV